MAASPRGPRKPRASQLDRVADSFYEILFPRARRDEAWSHTDHAYEILWKKIVGQELWPGGRVLDTAIAQEAGISRTPVREAIQRLVQDGLLEQLPRGVRVARLSAGEVAELYDYRTALEVYAARRATSRVPRDRLQSMMNECTGLRDRLAAPDHSDGLRLLTEYQRHDAALHQLLLYSGGNRYLARAMAAIHGQLSYFHVAGTRLPSRVEHGLDDHEAILRALLAEDGVAAGDAMDRHIQRVKERMLVGIFGVDHHESAPEVETALSPSLPRRRRDARRRVPASAADGQVK